MRKFQEQEENFQKQEKRHDDQLYEVEKQYMLDRDRWNFCLNYSEILHVLTELNSITNSTWLKLKIELFFFFFKSLFQTSKRVRKTASPAERRFPGHISTAHRVAHAASYPRECRRQQWTGDNDEFLEGNDGRELWVEAGEDKVTGWAEPCTSDAGWDTEDQYEKTAGTIFINALDDGQPLERSATWSCVPCDDMDGHTMTPNSTSI